MSRLRYRIPLGILVLGLPALLHGLLPKGDPFLPFSLVGIDDVTYTVTLQDARLTLITEKDGVTATSHPAAVLIDFWATWCVPCRAAMPYMQELFDRYKPEPEQAEGGLVLMGIALDRRGGRVVKPFYKNLTYTYPMLADPTKGGGDLIRTNLDMKSAYGVQGIPVVYLIDSRGAIRHVHTGFKPENITEIDQQVQMILKGDRQ